MNVMLGIQKKCDLVNKVINLIPSREHYFIRIAHILPSCYTHVTLTLQHVITLLYRKYATLHTLHTLQPY